MLAPPPLLTFTNPHRGTPTLDPVANISLLTPILYDLQIHATILHTHPQSQCCPFTCLFNPLTPYLASGPENPTFTYVDPSNSPSTPDPKLCSPRASHLELCS